MEERKWICCKVVQKKCDAIPACVGGSCGGMKDFLLLTDDDKSNGNEEEPT